MGRVRGHDPFVIEEINGLWARGDDESCPSDHLISSVNVQFFHSGVETRPGIDVYTKGIPLDLSEQLRSIKRAYTYSTPAGQTLIVMSEGGLIHHVVSPSEIYTIINIPGADDFAFISIAGRAYISPFKTYVDVAGNVYSLGMKDQFVWVYYRSPTMAAGTSNGARLAGGPPPSNATVTSPGPPPVTDGGKKFLISYNSSKEGKVTKGVHIITISIDGTVGPSDHSTVVNAPGDKMIEINNIPLGGTIRRIAMTKAIPEDKYTSTPTDWATYPFFLAATMPDAIATSVTINLADADLTASTWAGPSPLTVQALQVFNTTRDGFVDPGFHLVAVVFESDSGYLSAPGPEHYAGNTYINEKKSVKVTNIPLGDSLYAKKRHIISTKVIPEYNGDQKGYQFFFVPKATLTDNTTTEITIDYYDSDLVADASHLTDNFGKIPAGVNFCEYHGRLVLVGDSSHPKKEDGTVDLTQPDNRSVAYLSAPGEPEAFNQIDGLIITPLDGTPLTHCESFRDVLYLFKQNRTYSVVDNEDEPTTWGPVEVVDQGIGASVHGIAEVLDSGGTNVDYLIVGNWSGLMLFNGTYARPELSWKIENIWSKFDRNYFQNFQVVNDTINKRFYILPAVKTSDEGPSRIIYLADYGNGLDPKDIRWSMWEFTSNFLSLRITSINLFKVDQLIVGSWEPFVGITDTIGGGLLVFNPANHIDTVNANLHDTFWRRGVQGTIEGTIRVWLQTAFLGG